jgi:hypothetical protein
VAKSHLSKLIPLLVLLLSSCSIVDDSFLVPGQAGAVTSRVLSSLEVTPVNVVVPLGLTQTFRAMATFNDGTTEDVSGQSSWQILPGTGNVPTAVQGVVQTLGGSQGSVTVQALYMGTNTQAGLTVGPPQLVSLSICPRYCDCPFGCHSSLYRSRHVLRSLHFGCDPFRGLEAHRQYGLCHP